MLSILVCHAYYLHLDKKQRERAKPYPPLATLRAAALLREAGHRVTLFDAMLADGTADYERALYSCAPQLVLIYEDHFNFLSKMCLDVMRQAACTMIASACLASARVIVAGPDVNDAPLPYLRAGADLALAGEGLSALLAILPRLQSAPAASAYALMHGIAGVTALIEGRVRRSAGAVHAMPEADRSIAWDLLDVPRYRSIWHRAHGYFSMNMAASRGCSFRCTWCAKPIWGNQYLQRDAAQVAAEMLQLKCDFAPDHIWFADDIFGMRVDWVQQFARALAAGGGGIAFTIQTRADLISERMALALREAGCREVWLGAESGSQRVLDAMKKGTTVLEIHNASARLRSAGIRVGFFIQLGYPGESVEDIDATRALVDAVRPDEIGVSVAYPLPGTAFYDEVKEQLGAQQRWRESNDLAMMFRGAYTSAFYRAIRNALHELVAQGIDADPHVHACWRERWQDLLQSAPEHSGVADTMGKAPLWLQAAL